MIRHTFEFVARMIWRLIRTILHTIWIVMYPALRFIASVFLLVAVIALVADVTRMQLGGEGATFAPLSRHAQDFIPGPMAIVEKAIATNLHPFVWDPLITTIFAIPGLDTVYSSWLDNALFNPRAPKGQRVYQLIRQQFGTAEQPTCPSRECANSKKNNSHNRATYLPATHRQRSRWRTLAGITRHGPHILANAKQ